jgi:hypothetical protein
MTLELGAGWRPHLHSIAGAENIRVLTMNRGDVGCRTSHSPTVRVRQ